MKSGGSHCPRHRLTGVHPFENHKQHAIRIPSAMERFQSCSPLCASIHAGGWALTTHDAKQVSIEEHLFAACFTPLLLPCMYQSSLKSVLVYSVQFTVACAAPLHSSEASITSVSGRTRNPSMSDRLMIPMPYRYSAIRLNPTAMVTELGLDDDITLAEAKSLDPKTYLAFFFHVS